VEGHIDRLTRLEEVERSGLLIGISIFPEGVADQNFPFSLSGSSGA
jgi:hypothetical protein